MTALKWGEVGSRIFEAGVDRGVFYPLNAPGVSWNGLISVKEAPSETDVSETYLDGIKYRNKISPGSYSAQIEAFTYPEEFEEYDQQPRKPFGFSYRTKVGNDTQGLGHAYQIHIVYNAMASPTDVDYASLDTEIDAITFSWGISTRPIFVPGLSPSSHFIIDTSTAYSWVVQGIEDILYGTESTTPRLPTIEELLDLFENGSILLIVDHGDGTWTASGPDDVVSMIDSTTFQINWPSANYITEDIYTVKSL